MAEPKNSNPMLTEEQIKSYWTTDVSVKAGTAVEVIKQAATEATDLQPDRYYRRAQAQAALEGLSVNYPEAAKAALISYDIVENAQTKAISTAIEKAKDPLLSIGTQMKYWNHPGGLSSGLASEIIGEAAVAANDAQANIFDRRNAEIAAKKLMKDFPGAAGIAVEELRQGTNRHVYTGSYTDDALKLLAADMKELNIEPGNIPTAPAGRMAGK